MKNKKLKAQTRDKLFDFRQGFCLLAFLFGYFFTLAQPGSVVPCPTIIDSPISGTATFQGCEFAYALSTITSSANVEVKACRQIKLLPGFRANSGSYFHAHISDGCDTIFPPPPPDPCLISPVCFAKDAVVQIDQECKALITAADIDAGSFGMCSPLAIIDVFPSFFNCDDAGTIVPVTLTVVDFDGNFSSCLAEVEVLPPDPLIKVIYKDPVPKPSDIKCEDNTPPHPDVTAEDACGMSVRLRKIGPKEPEYERCFDNDIIYEYAPIGACYDPEQIHKLKIIRMADVEPPTFDKNASPIATIDCNDSKPPQEIRTVTDNCDPAPTVYGLRTETGDLCSGITVTDIWVAQDECYKINLDTLIWFIRPDTIAPEFTKGPDSIATINCDDPIPSQEVLTATDNCDPDHIVFMNRTETGDLCSGKTITDTWTATDKCFNYKDTSIVWYIRPDTEAPEFENKPAPIDDIYCCDPLPEQETLYATDNCDPNVKVTASIDDYYIDCADPNPITYRWSAVDTCGNIRDTSITFYVLPDDCGSGAGAYARSITDDLGAAQRLKLIPTAISVDVYPNPNNGDFMLNINSPESNQVNIQLYSMTRQLVYHDAFYLIKGKYQKNISLSKDLPNGLYILRAQIGEEALLKKIIISK